MNQCASIKLLLIARQLQCILTAHLHKPIMIHFDFLILVALFTQTQASTDIYYITTNSPDPCTVQPCLTLSQFAANSTDYILSNTTLVFLPGTHHLSKVNLTLSSMDNFVLTSENLAQIKCTSDSSIHFSQAHCIRITNLEFIGCGGNVVEGVIKFLVNNTKFEGQENSGTALELTGTIAQIFNSTLVSNRKGSYWLYFDGFIGGAIIATNSTIDISHSRFEGNRARDYGGAIFAKQNSIIRMSNNVFINNAASFGGALFPYNSIFTINVSVFQSNTGNVSGGALLSFSSTITIEASEFDNNIAMYDGGALSSTDSSIAVNASKFCGNTGLAGGGALYVSDNSTIAIEASEFHENNADGGGVLYSLNSAITIEASEFGDNIAYSYGGVLFSKSSTVLVSESEFISNSANISGGVILAKDGSIIQYCNNLQIHNNSANLYAVVYLINSEFKGNYSGNMIFSSNVGSLMALNGKITFSGYATFVNNRPNPSQTFQEGGAITIIQSDVSFDGQCTLEGNRAMYGGAIHSTGSRLYVNGNVTIAWNTATGNGGGLYLSNSELNCSQIEKGSSIVFLNNTAVRSGGGIHAISSTIKTTYTILLDYNLDKVYNYNKGARINFTRNAAKFGGGVSLEANAKLFVLKVLVAVQSPVTYGKDIDANTTIFVGNSADYGGAVYVNDETNSGTCTSDPKTECFFQVLALYATYPPYFTLAQCMYFSENYAYVSGSTLYGGLLDRCAVSQFSEFYVWSTHDDRDAQVNGMAYFKNVSTTAGTVTFSISSNPVRICICTNHTVSTECTDRHYVEARKGEAFTVSLVAIDQVGQPTNAIVQAFLRFTESGLAEGQLNTKVPAECTNVTFSVMSPHDTETLTLYASDGPCKYAELSKATVQINLLPCSCQIGLQVSGTDNTNCTCECHRDINEYMKRCDSYSGSLVKQPQLNAWISYVHESDTNLTGYLVYPNCPFDYCLSTSPPFYLNQPDGADAQCAFNRSSLLCGSCQPGLSLSLGSSRCLPCPSYWPALLTAITIAAILAGIALVTLLLALNMTVAVGTLNGLIFYANIVYANKSILLPFQETNFVTVFISWLNLDLGIDTCYFPWMDTYIKTWLELAFPAYIILLVVCVISISSHSTKFSNLIGKRDPVATLAMLILLSYSKLLAICFKSLSLGILEYPEGSSHSKMLWLPDANVKYLSVKHIPLFIAAVLILLVGLVYTALLFSWQCLLHLPRWTIFNWSRNPKIQTFIETYHMPYSPKHRYWTGLLLIARVVLYLVAATNVSNDPTVALTSVTSVVCSVVLLKGFIVSRLYRKWTMDVLETFFCLNILFLTISTWYSLGDKHSHQEAIAYTSVSITIFVLPLIILYHVYTYTRLFSKLKKTKFGRKMDRLFTVSDPKPKTRQRRYSPPPHDDNHSRIDDREVLDELDCPVYTGDYDTTPLLNPSPLEPTFSVVELHHPCLAPSHLGEEASAAENVSPKAAED